MENVAAQIAQLEARKLNIMQQQQLEQAAAADHLEKSREHNRNYFQLKAEAEQVEAMIVAARRTGVEQEALNAAAKAKQDADESKAKHDVLIASLEEQQKKLTALIAEAESKKSAAEEPAKTE